MDHAATDRSRVEVDCDFYVGIRAVEAPIIAAMRRRETE
jgi:hypothetical protein